MPEQSSFLIDEELASDVNETSLFAEPSTEPQVRVPRNIDEVAAQITFANQQTDGEEATFDEKFQANRTAIQGAGVRAPLDKVVYDEFQDNIEASKSMVLQFAKSQESDKAARATQAALDFERRQATENSETNPVEAQRVLATRALESVSAQTATKLFKTLNDYGKQLDESAGNVSLRNLLMQMSNAKEGEAGWTDKVLHFGRLMLPLFDRTMTVQAITQASGGKQWTDLYAAVTEFQDSLLGESKEVQVKAIEKILENVSENPSVRADVLRKLASLSAGDDRAELALDAAGAIDIAVGLGYLLRRGTPLVAAAATGGTKAAGELAAADLIKGTALGGLNEPELISHAIAAGHVPYQVDPAAIEGMSAAMQKKLADDYNHLLDSYKDRLNSSGLTEEEIKAANQLIREKYMAATNGNTHSVQFGDASADGIKGKALYQSNDGRSFMSKEAAEAWAKEQGLPTYRIVSDRTLGDEVAEVQAQIALHGGRSFTGEFSSRFIGTGQGGDALGQGFYATPAVGLAESLAKRQGKGAVYTIDFPENDKFLHWYQGINEQPKSVQKSLAKALDADTVATAKREGWTGQDIYTHLKDKLGSAEAASKKLDEAGIAGNYADKGGAHGLGPEHAIFNPKNIKIVSKEEVSGSTKKVERTLDEAADQGLMDRAIFDGDQDALDALRNLGYDFQISPTKDVTPVTKGVEPSFNSIGSVQITSAMGKETTAVLKRWLKDLGLTDSDLKIIHTDELGWLSNRYPHVNFDMKRIMNDKGALISFKNYSDKILVVNTAKVAPNTHEYVRVLTHELGHVFDKDVLRNMPGNMRRKMVVEFERWLDQRGSIIDQDIRDFINRFTVPDASWQKHVDSLGSMTLGDYAKLKPRTATWLLQFDEWWAEQFSKFMLTDAKPLSAFEEYLAAAAAKLKAFFMDVAEKLGMDTSKPEEAVSTLLREHMDRVQEIHGKYWKPLEFDAEDSVAALQNPGKHVPVPGKPHITFKREGFLVEAPFNEPVPLSAVGKFTQKDIDSSAMIAVDPKHGASEVSVEGRVVGVHAEAKTRKALTEYITPYYDKLSRAGKEKVVKLLEEGDAASNAGGYGKEFTYNEAIGRGLSAPEAEAYLATRQLRMAMYHIRNGELVKALRAKGLQEIEIVGTGMKVAGRKLEVSAVPNKNIYDIATKQVVDVSQPNAANGKFVVQLEHPVKIDGEMRSMFLADPTTAKNREIVTALHYRPGEFSRIHTDEYFITMTRNQKVDGQMKAVTETIRTAPSKRTAELFTEGVRKAVDVLKNKGPDEEVEKLIGQYFSVDDFKASVANGDFDDMTDIGYHYTRNKEEYLNGSVNEALANGRLFTSKRSEKLLSTDASAKNTLGVMQSLEAEITNVSRVANINQWRDVQVQKWMNTFGHLIPNRTGNDVADFFSAAGATFTKNDKNAIFAERTHKYIMRQIGVRTGEERYYEVMTRRLTENFLSGNEVVETIGAAVRQSSVLGFIRSINFNLTLGMFNPAQLIVQANGAATAIAMSPLHGMAAAKTFPLLRMALMSDKPEVWKFFANADKLTNLGLSSADEFVKLVKAVKQSGIIDNTRSTALFNQEEGKFNLFAGYPSKVARNHSFFFDRGEEFSRVVSFDTARREWVAANPGKDWTSKKALAEMVIRADDLTQNMTKANLARFQEGLGSVPLQFAQYNIKLAANIMSSLLGKGEGRGFTKPEALKLMAAHVVFYGAAGNGLSYLLDEMLPKETRDSMSVEAKTYLSQGLFAGLLNSFGEWYTGDRMSVAVGSRLGAFEYYERIAENLFTDPKGLYEALLGPTLMTAKRTTVAVDVAKLWMQDPDLTAKDVLLGLGRASAEQVSTLRNAAKAYLFYQHHNKMLNSKGLPMAQLTPGEVLAQALGFQPSASFDVYNLIKSKKDHSEALNDIASLIYKVQQDIVTARARGDHAYADEQHKLLVALMPENTGDLLEVQRIVRDKLFPHDTQFQKLLGDYLYKGQTYEQPFTATTKPRE